MSVTNSSAKAGLKVALMGTRGIPANYGGFETFAEELSVRLVERGCQVTVFGRHFAGGKRSADKIFRGVHIDSSFSLAHKYLETPLAALTGFLKLFKCRFDLILLCNAANSPFAWIPRLLGIPVIINVDGIERLRSKWNFLGRAWYRLGEFCSVLFASRIVADANVIRDYYQKNYKVSSSVIAYGATVNKLPPGSVLKAFNLEAGKYILYVSRLEPENNALGVIEAYSRLKTTFPLVVVGDAPYADAYKASLRAAANDQVVFTGYQFREAYQELRSNCYFYVQATEVGGTHPALVEAMAYGNCVIANGTPENIEVLGDAGLFYDKNNFQQLTEAMQRLLDNQNEVTEWGNKARVRAEKLYNWERVTNQYLELFEQFR